MELFDWISSFLVHYYCYELFFFFHSHSSSKFLHCAFLGIVGVMCVPGFRFGGRALPCTLVHSTKLHNTRKCVVTIASTENPSENGVVTRVNEMLVFSHFPIYLITRAHWRIPKVQPDNIITSKMVVCRRCWPRKTQNNTNTHTPHLNIYIIQPL